jgi:hypothetical protein
MVAATFKVIFLHTNTLSESTTAEKISGNPLLQYSSGWLSHAPECWQCLKICGLSKRSSVLGIAKSHRAKSGECDGWFSVSIDFLAKNSRQHAYHEQGHCHGARSKHHTIVQVFCDELPHITLPVFPNNSVGSLFNFVQETQSEQ